MSTQLRSLSLLSVALLGCWLSAPGWGQTRVVSASFYDSSNLETGPMVNLGPGFNLIAGITNGSPNVRVPFWNDLDGVTGAVTDLIDSDGLPTSVDVSYLGTDLFANHYPGGGLDGDATMMNGHLAAQVLGQSGLVSVTVSDIGGAFDLSAGYDVYVYVDTEDVGSDQILQIDDGLTGIRTLSVTDNVDDIDDMTGIPLIFDPNIDYDDATLDGRGTYVVFTGLQGDLFRLLAMSPVDGPAYINGFQIVGRNATIPEPSGLLLLGMLVGAGLVARRSV